MVGPPHASTVSLTAPALAGTAAATRVIPDVLRGPVVVTGAGMNLAEKTPATALVPSSASTPPSRPTCSSAADHCTAHNFTKSTGVHKIDGLWFISGGYKARNSHDRGPGQLHLIRMRQVLIL